MEQVFESEKYLDFIRVLSESGIKAHVTLLKDGQCVDNGVMVDETAKHLRMSLKSQFKPRCNLPKLRMTIQSLLLDHKEVKSYATAAAQCWKKRKENYGECNYPIWATKVSMSKLTDSDKKTLIRAGYKKDDIAMEDIVSWSDLSGIPNFARGPDKSKMILKNVPWLLCLRVFILVSFEKTGINPDQYIRQEELRTGNPDIDDFEPSPAVRVKRRPEDDPVIQAELLVENPEPSPPTILESSVTAGPFVLNRGFSEEAPSSPILTPPPGSPILSSRDGSQATSFCSSTQKPPRSDVLKPFLEKHHPLEGNLVQLLQLDKQTLAAKISDGVCWISVSLHEKYRTYFESDPELSNTVFNPGECWRIESVQGVYSEEAVTILKFCRPKIYRNVAMVGFPLPLTCEGSLINKRVQAARTPVIVRRKQVAPTPPVAQNLIEDSFSQQLSTWDYKACVSEMFKDTPLQSLQVKYPDLKPFTENAVLENGRNMVKEGVGFLCGSTPVTEQLGIKSCGFLVKAKTEGKENYQVQAKWMDKQLRRANLKSWTNVIYWSCTCDHFKFRCCLPKCDWLRWNGYIQYMYYRAIEMDEFVRKYSDSKSFNLVKLACGIQTSMSAVQFLQVMMILPTFGFCVTCQAPTDTKVHYRQPGNYAFFRCNKCKKRVSLRTETFFEKARLSYRRFILLCYGYCQWNWKYCQVQKECCLTTSGSDSDSEVRSLSKKTIARYNNYFREVISDHMVYHLASAEGKIGGVGKTVEIDESLFGKRKYHRGTIVGRRMAWILGGICREDGKMFLVECPEGKRDRVTLETIILKYVLPGTTIYTDGWKAYGRLQHLGFSWNFVNHSREFVRSDNPTVHTQSVEGTWWRVKG